MKNRDATISDHWSTPKVLYKELKLIYGFSDFDPCPLENDISKFDGLVEEWDDCTFCNPPYSLQAKSAFVKKAVKESKKGKKAVLLIPVSTSTRLFHNIILPNASDIVFLFRRVSFEGINTRGEWVNPGTGLQSPKNPPARKVESKGGHDSMIVIFGGEKTPNLNLLKTFNYVEDTDYENI